MADNEDEWPADARITEDEAMRLLEAAQGRRDEAAALMLGNREFRALLRLYDDFVRAGYIDGVPTSEWTENQRTRSEALKLITVKHLANNFIDTAFDADAVRALAWMVRGEPQDEIVYTEDCPKSSPEVLKKFKPHSYIKDPNAK